MIAALMDAVFIIVLQIATITGGVYFVQPTESKYQRAFESKAACDEAARPLARSMKSQSTPPGITLKGVVCRKLEIAK